MARVKAVLMEMEELCWEAMEKGFYNVDDVYAYVNTHMANASYSWVEQILENIHRNDEREYSALA